MVNESETYYPIVLGVSSEHTNVVSIIIPSLTPTIKKKEES